MSGFSPSVTSTWSLVGSWTHSGDVANVDFINLGGIGEIVAIADGVAVSVSGAAMIQVSTNNGSSYYTSSGDYKAIDSAGTTANTIGATFWGTNSTAARYGTIRIPAANVVGAPKALISVLPSTTPLRLFVADNANDINAIRISGSAGGNLTAGSIWVFGR